MKRFLLLLITVCLVFSSTLVYGAENQTGPCIGCHNTVTPGIVKQWQDSKHSWCEMLCLSQGKG